MRAIELRTDERESSRRFIVTRARRCAQRSGVCSGNRWIPSIVEAVRVVQVGSRPSSGTRSIACRACRLSSPPSAGFICVCSQSRSSTLYFSVARRNSPRRWSSRKNSHALLACNPRVTASTLSTRTHTGLMVDYAINNERRECCYHSCGVLFSFVFCWHFLVQIYNNSVIIFKEVHPFVTNDIADENDNEKVVYHGWSLCPLNCFVRHVIFISLRLCPSVTIISTLKCFVRYLFKSSLRKVCSFFLSKGIVFLSTYRSTCQRKRREIDNWLSSSSKTLEIARVERLYTWTPFVIINDPVLAARWMGLLSDTRGTARENICSFEMPPKVMW